MALDIVTIPCLEDNYAFLLGDPETGRAALVDVPEAGPIEAALQSRGWILSDIILTHHHWDHVDGLAGLTRPDETRIIGAKSDAHRLPPLDLAVAQGDHFALLGAQAHVFDVSGHTLGHIAIHVPQANVVFTADSLMALGCGRLFEGTPAQIHASLQKLAALPPETIVCSGHEYTAANARFALTIEPQNQDLISRSEEISAARAKGLATVPSTLQLELATNPFLRAHVPAIKAQLGLADATDADVFAEIRARKDRF